MPPRIPKNNLGLGEVATEDTTRESNPAIGENGGGEPAHHALPVPAAAVPSRPLHVLPDGSRQPREDWVAREEPLDLRIAGETIAVIMRTPGHDERLALGFFFAEGLITSADDLTSLVHCGRTETPGWQNVLDATPAGGSRFRWDRLGRGRRTVTVSSAGGICGRRTVDDLLADIGPVTEAPGLAASTILAAVEGLGQRQPLFACTGGTHGAAAHAADGTALAWHEDVGRHNAVDKVVGALLLARQARARSDAVLLAVSGRVGFELVQKAARARIPFLAGVSAPTSLAVEMAERAGVTLAGFARGGRMNVYTHAHRIGPG